MRSTRTIRSGFHGRFLGRLLSGPREPPLAPRRRRSHYLSFPRIIALRLRRPAYLETAWIALATWSTFDGVSPATEMRPSSVQ